MISSQGIMRVEQEMWDLLMRLVDPQNDKIISPITGGLDSRVLVYILKLKGVRVSSYYIYSEYNKCNFKHIDQLCEMLEVREHTYLNRMDYSWQGLKDWASAKYDLKKYDRYTFAYNNVITGGILSKKDNRRYWYGKENWQKADWEGDYNQIVNMDVNPNWMGYCYSLPRHQRFLQKAYIRMINEFTPLGNIPRCFDLPGREPIHINRGFPYYAQRFARYKLAEQINKVL